MKRLLTTVSVLGLSAAVPSGSMDFDYQTSYVVTQIYTTTAANFKAQRVYAVTE